ncbi:hypothetical protein [Sporosarcina sp. G11-34]|uniref:hypothetical protein n=1 Tax=Sporosarcina sp. G11-34 TaxID=2849605 RepID=UPI0022A9A6A8|nr:hypothetical protein [Sporosarcina sp. G11-34]
MCTIETSGERIRKLGKQQLVALIEPYASRLTEGYEAARLLKLLQPIFISSG